MPAELVSHLQMDAPAMFLILMSYMSKEGNFKSPKAGANLFINKEKVNCWIFNGFHNVYNLKSISQ